MLIFWPTVRAGVLSLALLGGASDGSDAEPEPDVVALSLSGLPSAPAHAKATLALTVAAADAAGDPVAGIALSLVVTGGGGTLNAVTTVTNASGQAYFEWTLGAIPVVNSLLVTAGAAGQFAAVVDVEHAPALTPRDLRSSPGVRGA